MRHRKSYPPASHRAGRAIAPDGCPQSFGRGDDVEIVDHFHRHSRPVTVIGDDDEFIGTVAVDVNGGHKQPDAGLVFAGEQID